MFWLVISWGRPGAAESTQCEAQSHKTPQTWQRGWEKPDLARLLTPGSLFIPGQPHSWLPHARVPAGLAAKTLTLARKWLKFSRFAKSPRDGNFVTFGAAISGRFGKRINPEAQVVQPGVAVEVTTQPKSAPSLLHHSWLTLFASVSLPPQAKSCRNGVGKADFQEEKRQVNPNISTHKKKTKKKNEKKPPSMRQV